MADEIKVSIEEIESLIAGLKNKFLFIASKFKTPKNLDIKSYIWIVFAANIAYKSEDLITLLKDHQNKKIRIKSSLYIIQRAILEDLFYMRYILADNDLENIIKRFNAYMYSDLQNNLKHLNSIRKLQEKGKFIFESDDSKIFSEKGLLSKIGELKSDLKVRDNKYKDDLEFAKIARSFSKVEEVCKGYDEIKNIKKVELNKEPLSLEWVYNYLYRFKSMYNHQSISAKESVLDCIWERKSYKNNNVEVLSLLQSIFTTIEDTRKNILI